jgi:hypothetical protein
MMMKPSLRVACALSCLLVLACPLAMLDEAALSHAKDAIAPALTISSPAEGSLCANIVEVRGAVTDLADGGAPGKVTGLSYAVLGTALGAAVEVAEDGSFVARFETTTAGTQFTVQLTAADWNGNVSTASLSLKRDVASAVPDFTATPSNKAVTLTWSPVPKTQSYTLYYTTNGSLPSAANGTTLSNVSSPLTVSGCPNGSMCVFRLLANPETGWSASGSDYVQAIPLSPRSLAPHVYGEVGQIRVQWPEIPATDSFELFRRTGETGDFVKLGTVSGTEYIDTGLASGTDYYYELKPSSYSGVVSDANTARLALAETSPSIKTTVAASGRVYATAVSGNCLYMSDGTGGFKVVNISTPASPVTTRIVTFPANAAVTSTSEAYGFWVSGANLYIAVSTGILQYSITDPSNPAFVKGIVQQGATCVLASGSYLYTAGWIRNVGLYDDRYGVRVVRISDGALVQVVEYGNYLVTSLALLNGYLYAGDNSTLHIYSVNASTGVISLAKDFALGTGGSGIYISTYAKGASYYACIGLGQSFEVVNITNPSSPSIVKTITMDSQVVGAGLWGQRFLVFTDTDMVYGYDIATPTAPSLLYSLEMPAYPVTMSTSGGYAFIGANTYGSSQTGSLQVVFDPGMYEKRVARLTYSDLSPMVVTLNGHHAYVACQSTGVGLAVFDLSQPSAPSRIASLILPGCNYGIAISGTYAYVTNCDPASPSLSVIDIHDPANPTIVKTLSMPGTPQGIGIYGDMAVVTNHSSRLQFVDISDPANPALMAQSIQLLGKARSAVTVYAHHAYFVASPSTAQLQCLDLRHLGDPMASIVNVAMPPAITGSYAYAFDNLASGTGLYVTNVSDPFQPSAMGFAPFTVTNVWGPTVISGGYAYVSNWNDGVLRFSISNPRNPSYLLTFADTSYAQYIAIMGDYAVAVLSPGSSQYLEVYQLAP